MCNEKRLNPRRLVAVEVFSIITKAWLVAVLGGLFEVTLVEDGDVPNT